MKRTAVQREVVRLIRFYESRGWNWTDAAEFTLCRESGRLALILGRKPFSGKHIGRPRKGALMRLAYLYCWIQGSWQMYTYGPCDDGYILWLNHLRGIFRKYGTCTAIVRREFKSEWKQA